MMGPSTGSSSGSSGTVITGPGSNPLTLSDIPASRTSSTTADITVSGFGYNTYKYKLDTGTWLAETPLNTHIILSNLSEGEHIIFVIGKDSTGKWQAENEAVYYSWSIDTVAPSSITNLNANNPTSSSIDLSWTAPGDDGTNGTASSYEIKYATVDINNDDTCDASTDFIHSLDPDTAGNNQNITVTGLSNSTTYYFCIRAIDEAGNRGRWIVGGVSQSTNP